MGYIRQTLAIAAAGTAFTFAAPANAALVLVGTYVGNDCQGGGFSSCYASEEGINQLGLGSPAVVKYNNGGSTEVSSNFPSIDGSEFEIDFVPNTLSFIYTPGVDDPAIHYFAVKQGRSYALFYDSDPILSGSVNMNDYFAQPDDWSHITFFDTGTPAVPEPATWLLMILGFGAIGLGMRRRNTAEPRMRVLYN